MQSLLASVASYGKEEVVTFCHGQSRAADQSGVETAQVAVALRASRPFWYGPWPVVIAIAVAAVLAFVGLTNQAFWDDEANTALFARNLLKLHKLSAWDGTNLIGFRQGAELDERLVNVYMPPAQYYTAALGLRLFGYSTFGGRVLFVVAGLAALVILALWTNWHWAGRLPPWLPVGVVALSPAYLMFSRQCRYYSVAVLLSVALLALLSRAKTTWKSRLVCGVLGAACAVLLMLTNYLDAVAAATTLPVFLLLRRYRTRANLVFLGTVYLALTLVGLHVLATANPLAADVAPKGPVVGLARLATLLWWHTSGLARFEFFPVLVPVVLVVLWAVRRRTSVASVLAEALLICVILGVYTITVVLFSPQTVAPSTRVADMRYVVALMPIGAAASSAMLVGLWRLGPMWGPALAVISGVSLTVTNAFTLAYLRWQPLRSTLYLYVKENTHDYTTGNETLIEYLRQLPPGRVIRVVPDFMAYPAMFYVPQHLYCCQLGNRKIDDKVRSTLPDYVYFDRVRPDYILVGADISPQELLEQCAAVYGPGRYRLGPEVGETYRDTSRPEIPWHTFGQPRKHHRGFMTLERIGE
jgi:hypothetical protein